MPLPWSIDGPIAGADCEQLTDTLTRQLLPKTRRIQSFETAVPPPFLGLELGDEVGVTHYGGYDSGGAGWGPRTFERRHVEATGIEWDPWRRPGTPTVTFDDVRGALQRTVCETGIVSRYDRPLKPGNFRTIAGPFNHFRPTIAYHDDPAGGPIQIIDTHVPIYSDKGVLIQRMAENIVLDSIFATTPNSGAPWTSTLGAGGAITADSTQLIFEKAITPTCHKIVSGTGGAFEEQVLGKTPNAGDQAWISIDHYDPSGTGLYYSLYDAGAGKAWNAGTHTWNVSAVRIWNQLPAASSASARHDDYVVFGTGNVIAFAVGFPNLGVSKTSYVQFAQIEWGRAHAKAAWPSSRQGTPAGFSAIRGASTYCIGNDSGARAWNAVAGTFLWKLTPLWKGANVTGLALIFDLFRVVYDANNYFRLFWDGDNTRWTFRRRSGGTNTDINASKTILPLTAYTGACRWGSAAGELTDFYGANASGKTWFDLILDGVNVGHAESIQPVETTLSHIKMGGGETLQINGYLQWEILPYVLSETEVARWLA